MGRRAPGVHHALGNALVVEVGDLLPEDEVFQERRAAGADLEGVLVVVDPQALVGGEELLVRDLPVLLELLLLGAGRSGVAAGAGRGVVFRFLVVMVNRSQAIEVPRDGPAELLSERGGREGVTR